MASFSDNFNRADGGIGANYSDMYGNGLPNVASNEVTMSATVWQIVRVNSVVPATANQQVELEYRSGTDGALYVCSRLNGINGTLAGYYAEYHAFFNTISIYKMTAAAFGSALASYSVTLSAGQTFGIRVVGSTLYMLMNGAPVGSPVSDSSYSAAGDWGLGITHYTTPYPKGDNFLAQDYVGVLTGLPRKLSQLNRRKMAKHFVFSTPGGILVPA